MTAANTVLAPTNATPTQDPDTTFDGYQQHVDATIVRTAAHKLEFVTLGLCGEAGELAEKVKKWMRGDYELTDEVKAGMAKELGDILWHVARTASIVGYSLSDVVRMNNKKLAVRLDSDKINGNGDNR